MELEPLERSIATFVGFCIAAYGYRAFVNSTSRNRQFVFTIGDIVWVTISFGMICAFGHAVDAFAVLGVLAVDDVCWPVGQG